jgi:hypothetical protein
MEELQLKYVEIAFDKQAPQQVGTEISISGKIDGQIENLEYKFIVGKGGIWNTIQEFSKKNDCVWKPKREGEYMVMVQAREKGGKKPLDYVAKEDYSIVTEEVIDAMNEETLIENFGSKVEIERENKDIVRDGENDSEISGEEDSIEGNVEFKEAINNIDDNVVFLEVKEISKDEKEILMANNDVDEETAFSDDSGRLDHKIIDIKEIEEDKIDIQYEKIDLLDKIFSENKTERELNFIKDIIIDKEEIKVGEKCSIEIKTNDKNVYLYRYYVKRNSEWDAIKDYDTSNILKYTANEVGEKEFLIQCKRMESTETFEDYRIIKLKVKDISKIEITNFKCLSNSLIVGDKLEFLVETNIRNLTNKEDKIVLLYKFYKIYKDGKSSCIQDYSTKNDVCYKETEAGSYRLLCLVKSILSNKEYDDRAILVYNVKPYEDIRINSFVADLNSPQASETDIKFTSEVQGGNNILYKYKVNGPIKEDTGFTAKNEFLWKPIEAGEYEIILYVKDCNYKGDYEDAKKIAFTIERKGENPVKILDIVVDKEKKIITGEPVNIMVNGEGGTRLQYAFTIRKDGRRLEWVDYNKSNWINFIPKQTGEYEVEIMLKDKYSNKPYDIHTLVYLKAMEYLPGEIDYIILPYKETHLIGETIEFECIIQNTQNVLVKYETKINGHSIEQTEFSKNKKLRLIPKIAGKYTIEVYAKNIKCTSEYDSKKQINLYVSEAPPVIETNIITNTLEGHINEELTFEAVSRGGKDVCYEFYLMENNEWRKVQAYSRKHYYNFIPYTQGKYKLLALAKSYYKKVSYEDYAEVTFYVKGLKR